MRSVISWVPVRPKPLARTRTKGGSNRVWTPRKSQSDKKTIAEYVALHMRDQGNKGLFSGPVRLTVGLHFNWPKSWSEKKRRAPGSHYVTNQKLGDWDNLGKLVSDALEGVVYENDRQVCQVTLEKLYGPREGIYIKVDELYSEVH
jgi:Holliday junction resolvase RusA-like endonuclease